MEILVTRIALKVGFVRKAESARKALLFTLFGFFSLERLDFFLTLPVFDELSQHSHLFMSVHRKVKVKLLCQLYLVKVVV